MAQLGHLAQRVAAILCLLIFQLSSSDSRAHTRISGGTGTCISRERDALLSFKASLLDPARHLPSWQGEDCCQWNGVRCSNRTGHVVKLNLRNTYGYSVYDILSLSTDEMSSSLADLQQLRYLDLSWNDFNGASIPVFVGSLKNLRYLNLSSSAFGGRIPSQLGNLSKLQYLDVSGNYYYHLHMLDLAWLSCLSLLSHVDLSQVDLGAVHGWVHMVNTISSLKVLRLADCGLNNTVFATSKSNLTHLEVLDLSSNLFNTSLEHNWFLWDLTSLKDLYLVGCDWHGPIPEELGNMTSLEVIDLSVNDLVGLIPSNLQNLCNLKVLRLVEINIDASIGEFMGRVPSLTGKIPEEISLLIGLTNLNLSNNHLIGRIPNQIGDLKQLESLDLSYNELSGEIPSGLSDLTSLSHLNLSYNNISGVIPSRPQLQILDNQIYIYIGNPGLCGYPLSKNCSTSTTGAEQSVDEDANYALPLYLGMSIGFVIGLWTVFCTMLLRRSWAIVYFQIIDKLYDKVYVWMAIAWAHLVKKTHDDAV
ncbi:receptor-like protein EIX2 [Triticum dicoccoides]|uniref:receptor-like protein EIX2 n=1 Tax=Triticum dicoccoides TaxID=85692 RepID=UPI001891A860|nr:receptor-like protein EIX2 [Triticum dicoccoides]